MFYSINVENRKRNCAFLKSNQPSGRAAASSVGVGESEFLPVRLNWIGREGGGYEWRLGGHRRRRRREEGGRCESERGRKKEREREREGGREKRYIERKKKGESCLHSGLQVSLWFTRVHSSVTR